ncbi:MAG: DNA-formamidopyrimidine glycosylase family protein [Ilumatobacter sp.]|uniref:DNA-formamidopyrimidine glycosylase family protein n=1 Tax=Ilumatobacter sp. TaxID=1967498 RepID=UPI00329A07CC
MPEGLEAEIWRRAASVLVGRRITDVWCDPRISPFGLEEMLRGARIDGVDRIGKVVRVVTDRPALDGGVPGAGSSGGGALGLHFGMTGRLEIDGIAPIPRLEYASGADRPEWDRLRVSTQPSSMLDGNAVPALRMNDPRRLGRLSFDEPITVGPDALGLTARQLRLALDGRTARIKTLLLDQSVVAGLGNLCADEVLFTAGIAPHRRADELARSEVTGLARACRHRLRSMLAAGGSTHGVLSPALRVGPGTCPRDGTPLARTTLGGRTAVWCPDHQS